MFQTPSGRNATALTLGKQKKQGLWQSPNSSVDAVQLMQVAWGRWYFGTGCIEQACTSRAELSLILLEGVLPVICKS